MMELEPSDPLLPSWDNILHNPTVNGLVLNEVIIPEEVLALVLSYVDLNTVPVVNTVCSTWKSITTQRSFWRLMYKQNGGESAWKATPESHKNKPNAWCLLYVGLKYKGFKTNFVKNGSGEEGFEHWHGAPENWRNWNPADEHQVNYNNCVIVETPPKGCASLDDLNDNGPNSCFATSYHMTELIQYITFPLSKEILSMMTPFQIKFSIMACVRFDCGGEGSFSVEIRDVGNQFHSYFADKTLLSIREGEVQWKEYSFTFVVTDENPATTEIVCAITLQGKDTKFWAGNYGIKYSRCSATFKLLTENEVETYKGNSCDLVSQT